MRAGDLTSPTPTTRLADLAPKGAGETPLDLRAAPIACLREHARPRRGDSPGLYPQDARGTVTPAHFRDLAGGEGAVVEAHLVESAGQVGRRDAGIAGEGEAGGRGGGTGGAGPGAHRLQHSVHVQLPAGGVDHEGDVVPLAVGVSGRRQGAGSSIPDVVGGVPEVPGAQAAAVGEDLVAVEGAGQVLVEHAVQAGVGGADPAGQRERKGVQGRGGGDVDVIVETVEGEGRTAPAGDPGGAVDEGGVEAVAGGIRGGGGAALAGSPRGERSRGGGGGGGGGGPGKENAPRGP